LLKIISQFRLTFDSAVAISMLDTECIFSVLKGDEGYASSKKTSKSKTKKEVVKNSFEERKCPFRAFFLSEYIDTEHLVDI